MVFPIESLYKLKISKLEMMMTIHISNSLTYNLYKKEKEYKRTYSDLSILTKNDFEAFEKNKP